MCDFRHRALRHHAQGVFEAERVFGTATVNSDGKLSWANTCTPARGWCAEEEVQVAHLLTCSHLNFAPAYQQCVSRKMRNRQDSALTSAR